MPGDHHRTRCRRFFARVFWYILMASSMIFHLGLSSCLEIRSKIFLVEGRMVTRSVG